MSEAGSDSGGISSHDGSKNDTDSDIYIYIYIVSLNEHMAFVISLIEYVSLNEDIFL